MNNPFAQHIGIWYTQEDEPMMIHIMQHLDKWLANVREVSIYGTHNNSIFLKDGSWIKAFPLDTQSRGQRLTTSFVINPYKSTKEIIDSVVRRCTTTANGVVCEITTDEEHELWIQLCCRTFI